MNWNAEVGDQVLLPGDFPGEAKTDEDGEDVVDDDGNTVWIVHPGCEGSRQANVKGQHVVMLIDKDGLVTKVERTPLEEGEDQ